MDPPRIELGTPRCKRGILPLDYGPLLFLFQPVIVFNIFYFILKILFSRRSRRLSSVAGIVKNPLEVSIDDILECM